MHISQHRLQRPSASATAAPHVTLPSPPLRPHASRRIAVCHRNLLSAHRLARLAPVPRSRGRRPSNRCVQGTRSRLARRKRSSRRAGLEGGTAQRTHTDHPCRAQPGTRTPASPVVLRREGCDSALTPAARRASGIASCAALPLPAAGRSCREAKKSPVRGPGRSALPALVAAQRHQLLRC